MRYDLALFEQLNEEYRDHPVVRIAPRAAEARVPTPENPPAIAAGDEAAPRAERQQRAATMQLSPILRDIDLTGKVVLEAGCRQGWLTSILPEQAGASKAIGVDLNRYPSWSEFTDPRVELLEADLSKELVAEPGSVDTIIANVSLGRDSGPLQVLPALYELLKEGGEVWLRTKAFTSPTASARFKEIFFPWPHLLFEDDVCEQFYLTHHGKVNQRFAWIHRMTVAHYLQAAREVGFEVMLARRKVAPIDIAFYLRFLDTLGRYAALDLETDLVTFVLSKTPLGSTNVASSMLDIEYTNRQHELDGRILQLIGGDEAELKGQQRPGLVTQSGAETAGEASSDQPPAPAPMDAAAIVNPALAETGSELGADRNINTPDYWDRVYRREWESGQVFSATYARDYGPVHDTIISLVPEDARVLDVACGSGVLCRKVKAQLPNTTVMGVDFSQYTIDRNQQVDRESGNEYRRVDVQTELASVEKTFDVIIMAEIIEHLDDAPRTIADAMGLLSPGGRLIITCPHDASIPSKEHVRVWGHDELFHLLAAHSDTVCFTQFPPSHDKWMMAHLVKSS